MVNWKLSVILLVLSVIACGMPVIATPSREAVAVPNTSASVNMESHTNTSLETSTVVICGRWNIRPAAGDLEGHLGWLENGTTVEVIVPATVTEDMGLWYELVDGGWVNARAVCNAR